MNNTGASYSILETSVDVKWNSRNKLHFQELGYEFTKYGDVISVSIDHLSLKSATIITAICVSCKKHREIKFCYYKDKCVFCANPKRGTSKKVKGEERIILTHNFKLNVAEAHVKTKWAGSTKKYYESLGYVFSKIGEEFDVSVFDLPSSSAVKVAAICRQCSIVRNIPLYNYSDYCTKCSVDANWSNPDFREKMSKASSNAAKIRNRINIGEKHYRWNPDRSYKERELHRGEPIYKQWAKDVKIRDNFTCQVCNKYRSKLCSHHLMSYLTNPELRFDLDNGVCLCIECHRDFHSKYTNKNNTKQQFEEYKFFKNLHNIISMNGYNQKELSDE